MAAGMRARKGHDESAIVALSARGHPESLQLYMEFVLNNPNSPEAGWKSSFKSWNEVEVRCGVATNHVPSRTHRALHHTSNLNLPP